ncbi:MAG: recombinase RecA [Firmicutes bacterium]|uniref:Protein RecA n=1 Tax=Candidatus Scatoplasma merdavium TaxID=2840932 RepID=A0A9D9D9Z9_9BACL|nr:recombinase RecA [Candidatus Scatoplasma merdavium]
MATNGENINDKELEKTLKEIEKIYGKGAVMRLGDRPTCAEGVIPSGSLLLDNALGIGGYPKGRIIEIYGPESSGKTTLALQAIAEVQKAGGRAAYIDAEHAIDPVYSKALGVDIDNLILSQPDYGEQALEIVDKLAESGAFDLIVVDSVSALVPKAELEGNMLDNSIGLQARLMSKALRKLAGLLSKSLCTVIFINQLREKMGVMYGNPEVTSGGRALKFYSSVRLDIRRGEQIKENGDIVGNQVKIKVVKNKVAPPFKTVETTMIYGKGISRDDEVIALAVQFELITKSGSWYYLGDNSLGQGLSAVKEYLSNNPEEKKEVEEAVRNKLSQITGETEE